MLKNPYLTHHSVSTPSERLWAKVERELGKSNSQELSNIEYYQVFKQLFNFEDVLIIKYRVLTHMLQTTKPTIMEENDFWNYFIRCLCGDNNDYSCAILFFRQVLPFNSDEDIIEMINNKEIMLFTNPNNRKYAKKDISLKSTYLLYRKCATILSGDLIESEKNEIIPIIKKRIITLSPILQKISKNLKDLYLSEFEELQHKFKLDENPPVSTKVITNSYFQVQIIPLRNLMTITPYQVLQQNKKQYQQDISVHLDNFEKYFETHHHFAGYVLQRKEEINTTDFDYPRHIISLIVHHSVEPVVLKIILDINPYNPEHLKLWQEEFNEERFVPNYGDIFSLKGFGPPNPNSNLKPKIFYDSSLPFTILVKELQHLVMSGHLEMVILRKMFENQIIFY